MHVCVCVCVEHAYYLLYIPITYRRVYRKCVFHDVLLKVDVVCASLHFFNKS